MKELPILKLGRINDAYWSLPRTEYDADDYARRVSVAAAQRDQTVRDMLRWFVEWLGIIDKRHTTSFVLQCIIKEIAELEGK